MGDKPQLIGNEPSPAQREPQKIAGVIPLADDQRQPDYAWRTILVALALFVLSLVIGREVYVRLIVPAPPLNFDEAAHSLPGYYILRDVLRLDLRAFWGDTHIQTLWPPGFSYLQAPVLLVLGLSDEAARLFAFVMLVLAILMSSVLAYVIKPELSPVAALASGLIALSAPGWLTLGSLALQEIPVAFVVFVVFWCYLRALKTQRTRWYVVTSCGLFFLFLTKYNYTAFALVAISLVDLGERLRRAWRVAHARRWKESGTPVASHKSSFARHLFTAQNVQTFLALYLPFPLGLAFWFFGGTDIVSTDVKWRDFRFFVTNEDSGYRFWSEQNLLFYMRATADWLMPSPGLAAATLVGALWAVIRVRHPGVTLLALFFAFGFALATAHPLKADRYIAPLFPSLWLLTGLGAADLASRSAHRGIFRRLSLVLRPPFLIAILLLGALASWLAWLPRLQPVWAGDAADALRAASHQIVAWQRSERPVLIIGTFGELSPPLFEWRLRTQPAFANGNIQYDAPPGAGSDIERVQHWLDGNLGTQVTLVEVAKDSPLYNTDDMRNKNAGRQTLVKQFSQVRGYQLSQFIDYPNSGLRISYYLPE